MASIHIGVYLHKSITIYPYSLANCCQDTCLFCVSLRFPTSYLRYQMKWRCFFFFFLRFFVSASPVPFSHAINLFSLHIYSCLIFGIFRYHVCFHFVCLFPGFVLLALESENPFSCICVYWTLLLLDPDSTAFSAGYIVSSRFPELGVVVMYRNALVCSSFLSSLYFVSSMCLGPLESGRVRVSLS